MNYSCDLSIKSIDLKEQFDILGNILICFLLRVYTSLMSVC